MIPESAYLDLMKYKQSVVFCDSVSGADRYLANITLTRRPSARELKFSTKADKYLSRLSDKASNSKKDDNNPVPPSQVERQLYRITLDYRDLNRATLNDTTISLPTLQSIESNFEGSIVTTLDLFNCFYSIELDEESKQYFNFFMQNEIWTHNVLAQGWSGSPKISRDAVDQTFSVKMLTKFLALKKIKDFPFTHYGQFW